MTIVLVVHENVTALTWPLGTKTKKTDIASSKSLNAKKVQCARWLCLSSCIIEHCMQIAKDMERWAKNVNAAKSAQQQQLQAVIVQERNEAASSVTSSVVYSDPTPSLSTIKRTGVPLASALQKVN